MPRDLDDKSFGRTNSLSSRIGYWNGTHVPSILVLLLPMKHERTEKYYLPCAAGELPVQSGGYDRVPMAFGDGDRQWAFEFSRLRTKGGSYLPYGAHLRVNPQLCKFAIIDGQHRAMALLALWRNLNKWPDQGSLQGLLCQSSPREAAQHRLRRTFASGNDLLLPQLHADNATAQCNFVGDQGGAQAVSGCEPECEDAIEGSTSATRRCPGHIRLRSRNHERNRRTSLRRLADCAWNLYYKDQFEDNESSLPQNRSNQRSPSSVHAAHASVGSSASQG